ncbi:MAG: T9SS type A sorting domain-containing protein [Candidatus Marinimicrobia bacterium]|nr:T9SS type A sorting domain-containing protein [Candidatus Neomarinimicrobiota bacterium]
MAQNAPIDFETGGYGASWTWSTFENDTNPALEVVANPSASGINTSATVAKFTALATGAAWAGCESLHGSDIGTFTLDASNRILKIMVYKSVISDVGIKLAKPDGWALPEIKVPNTVIDEWEELTFDLTSRISDGYDQIIIFPDFLARDQDHIVYFDNITFSEGAPVLTEPDVAAPAPEQAQNDVISIFSNVYTDVTVDTWSATWDNADVADAQVLGDDVKLYTNFGYAGIEFTSQPIDASTMTHFHIDIWTPDVIGTGAFHVKLVDAGADGVMGGGDDTESLVTFTANTTPALEAGTWVAIDIPLASFSSLAAKSHLAQLIIEGDPNTLYVDNIYFYSGDDPINVPVVAAPAPDENEADVISIFSDTYTDIAGVDINPAWSQTTVFSQVSIEGNNTLLYAALNYQGITFPNLDVSAMNYVHLDFWTANSTALNFYLISPGPAERASALPITLGSWVSVDIPLTDFSTVDLADLFQLKFDGNGNVYVDNIYFYSTTTGIEEKLVPDNFVLKQNYPNPFNPSTTISYTLNESGKANLSVYNINGQLVATVFDGFANAGEHTHLYSADGLAAGTYFYSLTAGNQKTVKKMVLIK